MSRVTSIGTLVFIAGLALAVGCGQKPEAGSADGNVGRRFLSKEEMDKFLEKRLPEGVDVAPRAGESPVRLVDGTEAAGIDFVQSNGKSQDLFYVEIVGNGAMFFDADGDGDQDLYLLNGKRVAGPPENPPILNGFFLNDGTGHFTDATAVSGLGDPRFSVGVCGADYDNDGDIDVYVTNFDEDNALYRNDGKGHFTDVAKNAGVTGKGMLDSSCAFGDPDNDGWLDLYVGYYVDHSKANNKYCEDKRRDGKGMARRYCNPADYNAPTDLYFHNRGDGTFEDRSEELGITQSAGRTLGIDFVDFDDDGDQDIFVACDRTSNLYFENKGDGSFTDLAMENGTGLSEEGKAQAGMGTVTGDYDNDGRIDLAVTYFEKEANGLYRNLGNHQFQQMAVPSGTARPSFIYLAWGTEFFDADLDGLLDWIIADGHVIPNVADFREPIANFEQPNLFFLNRGRGIFEDLGAEAGPGLEIEKCSRGLAVADIDGDGDLDAIVTNINERPDLLRNDSPRSGNHWLIVRTRGTRGNRDGIGARVVATLADGTKLTREIHSGQSYLSQSDMRAHFGLGRNETISALDIRWLSGATSHLENVPADQVLEVVEPAG